MNLKSLPILTFSILFLATAFRVWGLNSNPPHLTSDEAALGYNAYSILKTARDEHRNFLPVVFQSFGDWKPGLYVYLATPFVGIFGLNEWAVRLPSAIAGIFAVWLVGALTAELFANRKLGVLVSLFLAINPWHIHFSRGAWEANLSLTLVLLGVYFFLKGIKGSSKGFIYACVFFAMTLWAYQGAKLSTTLVVVALLVVYKDQILRLKRKTLLLGLLTGIAISFPIIASILQGKAGRLEVYSVFSYKRPEETISNILQQEGVTKSSWQYVLYHSETLNFARGILGRWFAHYSPRFLFSEGDWTNARHGAPDMGLFLFFDSILLLGGGFALFRGKNVKGSSFVLLWLLLSPLPAALSRDSVHAVRSYQLVMPMVVLIGIGAHFLFNLGKRNVLGSFILLGFILAYIGNYIYFLDAYLVHYPKRSAESWQYGYKQTVIELLSSSTQYEKIIFQQSYNQPYIFFLFYQKYDPSLYQKVVNSVYAPNKYGDVGLVSQLENIEFRDATAGDLHKKNTLIIYDPKHPPFPGLSLPQADGTYQEIKRPDGSIAFELLSFR